MDTLPVALHELGAPLKKQSLVDLAIASLGGYSAVISLVKACNTFVVAALCPANNTVPFTTSTSCKDAVAFFLRSRGSSSAAPIDSAAFRLVVQKLDVCESDDRSVLCMRTEWPWRERKGLAAVPYRQGLASARTVEVPGQRRTRAADAEKYGAGGELYIFTAETAVFGAVAAARVHDSAAPPGFRLQSEEVGQGKQLREVLRVNSRTCRLLQDQAWAHQVSIL